MSDWQMTHFKPKIARYSVTRLFPVLFLTGHSFSPWLLSFSVFLHAFPATGNAPLYNWEFWSPESVTLVIGALGTLVFGNFDTWDRGIWTRICRVEPIPTACLHPLSSSVLSSQWELRCYKTHSWDQQGCGSWPWWCWAFHVLSWW